MPLGDFDANYQREEAAQRLYEGESARVAPVFACGNVMAVEIGSKASEFDAGWLRKGDTFEPSQLSYLNPDA